MLTVRELFEKSGRRWGDAPELYGQLRILEYATGRPLPAEPFPAMITGYAKPIILAGDPLTVPPAGSRPYPNSPFVAASPCTDPATLNDCTSTADDQFLPCGIYPVRYKWAAPMLGLHSSLCGFRRMPDNSLMPWRQAFYAVNTAHLTQDIKLDYDYTRVNVPVIMCFGEIGILTNNQPEFGFFFHHMTDPAGAAFCEEFGGGAEQCGCCVWDEFPITHFDCENELDCFTIHDRPFQWFAGPDADPNTPGIQTACFGNVCPEIC